jgi:two-component system OmpR family sensor kinase
MSLRARLLVVLLFVAAAVAVTVDGVTYLSLRSFLLQRVDAQLDAAHRPIIRSVGSSVQLDDLATLAPGLYVEIRDPEGDVTQEVALRRAGEEAMSPPLPVSLAVPETQALGRSHDDVSRLTVSTEGERFRVATWRLTDAGTSLVLALPLDDLDSTLRRLLLVELVVTGAALAAGVVLARWLVTVGLRPLDDIATTAGAIAGGDLSQRVEREEQTTEVGRLGAALNAMLGQIERAFAERRASEEQLRRFVGDASHELRTPLTSIRAYAELFDRGADQRPEDLARVLKGIEAEAERMGVLVDDLLLLARLDQGRVLEGAPVDLGALAAESVDAARAIDPDRPLSLSVEGSVEVVGDRVRLRQVVDNLLANVRAHTPAGAPAAVSVGVAGDRPIAVLEVTDHGPGIAEEDRRRVFERFFRADPSRSRDAGGAGLGLAIVAAIAAAHGGRAGVHAGPGGVGSSFRIELPQLEASDS